MALRAPLWALVPLLAAGCSLSTATSLGKRSIRPVVTPQQLAAVESERRDPDEAPDLSAPEPRGFERRVGDSTVQRFSGAFAQGTLELAERVVAKDGDEFIVETTLTAGKSKTTLRRRIDARTGAVAAVSRIVDGGEEPATLRDYETMVERTSFAPDANDAPLDTKVDTCLVAGVARECEIRRFRVTVQGRTATLSIAVDRKTGEDVGGDVTFDDGKVMYRAETVERTVGTTEHSAFASRR